jgi:molecular chaperone GrpE
MADAKKKSDELSDVEAAIEEIMGEQEPGDEDVHIDLTELDTGTDQDEIAALTAERDELRDKFMRALADAENSRKRSERDRREAENYGGSKLARDMLPVYDNLNRALESVPEDMRDQAGGLIEGVQLTMRELLNIFEKHGITKVTPELGDRFDPQMHEAMFEAPVPGTKSGDIIQVMAEGFMLHDRLLRPAQVGVSSTPG